MWPFVAGRDRTNRQRDPARSHVTGFRFVTTIPYYGCQAGLGTLAGRRCDRGRSKFRETRNVKRGYRYIFAWFRV
jgi:hypothetical protein